MLNFESSDLRNNLKKVQTKSSINKYILVPKYTLREAFKKKTKKVKIF